MKYTAKRIGMLLITMVLVSLLTFVAFSLVSGDPAQTKLGVEATPEALAALRHEWGLDRPLIVRYISWLGGFFTGDLGVSYRYGSPVWSLVAPKLGLTLLMCLMSFLLIVVISIPLGVWSHRWVGGAFDWVHTAFNQLCMAVPPFFTGILLSYAFGILLRVFVPGESIDLGAHLARSLRHLFFAAVCVAIPRIAMTVRMMRATVVGEMNKAYVRTAISRGNDRHGVLWGHVLKNSLVATVTFLGQTMAEIIGGSIVVEQVFGVPGLGSFLVSSINTRDYPVVQTIVVILAFWVVLAGTLADLIDRAIDPRLRLGGTK